MALSLVWHSVRRFSVLFMFNPIHDGFFRGCSRMEGDKKHPLTKIFYTYPTMLKLSTFISYVYILRLYLLHLYLLMLTSAFFQQNLAAFVISKNTYTVFAFQCKVSNFLNFLWVLKGCFDKHGCNFDDVSKIGYTSLF